MKKAAIAIDDWKLPIFKRHLAGAGYTFKQGPGLTKTTLMLTVETNNVAALGAVVQAANNEAALSKRDD